MIPTPTMRNVVIVISLLMVGFFRQTRQLSQNSCLETDTVSTVRNLTEQGISNVGFIPLLIKLGKLYSQSQLLTNSGTGSHIISSLNSCLTYSAPYSVLNFTQSSNTSFATILNIFRIEYRNNNKEGSYCLIEGLYVAGTDCDSAMTVALSANNLPTEITPPDITTAKSEFNPFHIANTFTFVLAVRGNQVTWIQEGGDIKCTGGLFSEIYNLQQHISSLIKDIIVDIFSTLHPLLKTVTPATTQSIIVTNDSSFQEKWGRINHYPALYTALTGKKFPKFVFQPGSGQTNYETEDERYIIINQLAGNILSQSQSRRKRSIFSFLFGEDLSPIKSAINSAGRNFQSISENEKGLSRQIHQLTAKAAAMGIEQKSEAQLLNLHSQYLSRLTTDLKMTNFLTNNDFISLNKLNFLQHLDTKLNILQDETKNIISDLYSDQPGCKRIGSKYACNIRSKHYAFTTDLFVYFVFDSFSIQKAKYLSCLPIHKTIKDKLISKIFKAHNKIFLFDEETKNYNGIANNFSFNRNCLYSETLCKDQYQLSKPNLFEFCNIALVPNLIKANCNHKSKIFLEDGGYRIIDTSPVTLQSSNFPLKYKNQYFQLSQALSLINYHPNHLDTNNEANINYRFHGLLDPTFDKVDFETNTVKNVFLSPLESQESVNISHVLLSGNVLFVLCLALACHCCLKAKVKCYRENVDKIRCCFSCRRSYQPPSDRNTNDHVLPGQQQPVHQQQHPEQQQQDRQNPERHQRHHRSNPPSYNVVNNAVNLPNFKVQS